MTLVVVAAIVDHSKKSPRPATIKARMLASSCLDNLCKLHIIVVLLFTDKFSRRLEYRSVETE